MSAIAGIWNLDGRGRASADLDRMQAALAPFGPDRAGAWDGGAVAMGSRLAHLLPEDAHDRQPLTGGGGRFILVADLRLDNRRELAGALALEPAGLAMMADADLLLAAWERWGLGCLPRLLGDFAFAIWDRGERRLHLVRDGLGGRPLFLARTAGRIAFASMYHGLHALPQVPRGADLAAVRAHSACLPPLGPGTFHVGIDRVEPGTSLTIKADGSEAVDRWWEFPAPARLRLSSDEAYADLYRETFERCVHDRLRSCGPIASQLSAGLDSSAVTATAASLLADRGQTLTAYTAVPMADVPIHAPAGRIIDESPFAARTAARFPNIRHELTGRDGRAIGEDFSTIYEAVKEPVRNICNWTWILDIQRQMQARGERVLLVATDGNATVSVRAELLRTERLLSGQVTGMLRDMPLGELNAASLRAYAYSAVGPLLPRAMDGLIRKITGRESLSREPFSPLTPRAFREMVAMERQRRRNNPAYFDPGGRLHALVRSMITQLDTGPRQKMHLAMHGVDRRDPCRDLRLIRLIVSLPPDVIGSGRDSHRLYRRVFDGRVPEEIHRPPMRKGLQTADWSYRVERGRRHLTAVLDRAAPLGAIAEMYDLPGIRADAENAQDHARANSPEYARRRRWRFLHGLVNLDFLTRASLP